MDILLDPQGDILFQNGKISFTKNVAQKVSISLKIFKEEWFLNNVLGVPYFQAILGKKISKEKIDSIFKSQILAVDSVLKINSFSSVLINQKYQYKFEILSHENKNEVIEDKIWLHL